jgi:hypothetical protein
MVLRSGVAMVSDLDIWRAANLLIRRHGANAELEAAKRSELRSMLRRAQPRAKPGGTGSCDFCTAGSNNKEWWQQKR